MKDDGLYECHVGIIDKTSRNKVILDSGSIVLTVIGRFSFLSCAMPTTITFKVRSGFTMQSGMDAVVSQLGSKRYDFLSRTLSHVPKI